MSDERDTQGSFTLADMKAAKLAGIGLGLEAAAHLFARRATLNGSEKWREDGARIADAIRALDPERVAREDA